MYHGMGHFNACFKIARMLKHDHDVVFAGAEFYKKYMESQGFMYYALKTVPFGLDFENWVNEQENRKYIYLHSLKDRWTNRLFNLREIELRKLLHDIGPDYLFIDSLLSTDFIVLYPYLKVNPVKVAFIQTMLPTQALKNTPPINSLIFPGDIEGIKKAIKKSNYNQFKKKLLQTLAYLGMSDDVSINRKIKKNKIPARYQAIPNTLKGISFTGIDELILSPKEFDFNTAQLGSMYYIGFMADKKRMEISDMEYFKVDSLIRKKIKDTNGTLLYCSFGSVKSKDSDRITSFIQKLINVVRDANCVLIVSLTSTHHNSTFINIPENVFLLKAAPQLEILERTDVFITHGGLNSIRESIAAGVPMLIYPPHSEYDTMGNSTRVVYHKLGLRGDLENDTEDEISAKIEELLDNDIYKRNIYALREVDDGYVDKFKKVFEGLKPLTE
jgi:UDP:flavonoid glycosyltransferase YjiC (YdhE family)